MSRFIKVSKYKWHHKNRKTKWNNFFSTVYQCFSRQVKYHSEGRRRNDWNRDTTHTHTHTHRLPTGACSHVNKQIQAATNTDTDTHYLPQPSLSNTHTHTRGFDSSLMSVSVKLKHPNMTRRKSYQWVLIAWICVQLKNQNVLWIKMQTDTLTAP